VGPQKPPQFYEARQIFERSPAFRCSPGRSPQPGANQTAPSFSWVLSPSACTAESDSNTSASSWGAKLSKILALKACRARVWQKLSGRERNDFLTGSSQRRQKIIVSDVQFLIIMIMCPALARPIYSFECRPVVIRTSAICGIANGKIRRKTAHCPAVHSQVERAFGTKLACGELPSNGKSCASLCHSLSQRIPVQFDAPS
jgi:hypothetical protein